VLTIRPLARGRDEMARGAAGRPMRYYALITASTDAGYDWVRICRERDCRAAVAELSPGKWSDWWLDEFIVDGAPLSGYVRAKLVALSPEGDTLELFVPQIWPATGYTQPPDLAAELDRAVGNFLQNPGRDALGIVDDDTYFELLEFHHRRLADVAEYLAGSRAWDALFLETHASD
jgi:hypothetical protein